MPVVIPQYTRPESITADGAFRAIETQNSSMERAQRMRLNEERAQQQRQMFNQQQAEYIATAPVRDATRQMEIASAQGKIAAGVQMQNLMTTAQAEMPNIRARWNATMQLEDPEERLMEQERVLGMADRFGSLQDVGPEIKQWHNVWAQGAINQRVRDTVAGRQAVADVNAQAKIETADKAQTGMTARNDANIDARKTLDADRLKNLEAEAQAAESEGDVVTARMLRDRITRTTTFAPQRGKERAARQLPSTIQSQGQPTQTKPADQAPAVQKAVQNPQTGTRAKQNGVWYQFDGKNWVAEKSK